jgi:hypothetical protein
LPAGDQNSSFWLCAYDFMAAFGVKRCEEKHVSESFRRIVDSSIDFTMEDFPLQKFPDRRYATSALSSKTVIGFLDLIPTQAAQVVRKEATIVFFFWLGGDWNGLRKHFTDLNLKGPKADLSELARVVGNALRVAKSAERPARKPKTEGRNGFQYTARVVAVAIFCMAVDLLGCRCTRLLQFPFVFNGCPCTEGHLSKSANCSPPQPENCFMRH